MDTEELTRQLMEDSRNKEYTDRGIAPVFQIHSRAKILIIGQAPGRHVERSGIPFHDKSGETLMRWLDMDQELFYSEMTAILPMDFYYPGKGKTGDLPPRSFIFKEYHERFTELLPEVVCTILVGNYAINGYLKGRKKRNLTETVRNFREYLPEYFPIVHPSPLNFRWQKNNPWFEEEVVPALREYVKKGLQIVSTPKQVSDRV